MRRIHFFASSYRVRFYVSHEQLMREYVLFLRDVVREGIAEAMAESLGPRNLVIAARPHVLVSDVRLGSVELEAVLRVLADIPWQEIGERSYGVFTGLADLAARVMVVREIGRWIKGRLHRRAPDATVIREEIEVTAEIESKVDVEPELLAKPEWTYHVDRTLASPKPSGLITVVKADALPQLDTRLRRLDDRHTPHLGGAILLHQLNMASNGVDSLEQLHEGDPLVLQNAAAFGLKRCDTPDTLYRACATDPEVVTLLGVKMNNYPEEAEQPRIVRGALLDADDLPEPDQE